ncbi:MAG: 6-pyruvoyl tetrahydropterin synthase family protein [Solirubrobacteraceae bacterium]
MKVTVFRKSHFNAAHQLTNKDWSDSKNEMIFGKCSNPYFHGHNYEYIVGVTGEIDPETGFVISLDVLKLILEKEIEDYLDHKNLNIQVPEFKTLIPTAENIAVVIWNRIKAKIDPKFELKVTLYETPRNFVEYNGN